MGLRPWLKAPKTFRDFRAEKYPAPHFGSQGGGSVREKSYVLQGYAAQLTQGEGSGRLHLLRADLFAEHTLGLLPALQRLTLAEKVAETVRLR